MRAAKTDLPSLVHRSKDLQGQQAWKNYLEGMGVRAGTSMAEDVKKATQQKIAQDQAAYKGLHELKQAVAGPIKFSAESLTGQSAWNNYLRGVGVMPGTSMAEDVRSGIESRISQDQKKYAAIHEARQAGLLPQAVHAPMPTLVWVVPEDPAGPTEHWRRLGYERHLRRQAERVHVETPARVPLGDVQVTEEKKAVSEYLDTTRAKPHFVGSRVRKALDGADLDEWIDSLGPRSKNAPIHIGMFFQGKSVNAGVIRDAYDDFGTSSDPHITHKKMDSTRIGNISYLSLKYYYTTSDVAAKDDNPKDAASKIAFLREHAPQYPLHVSVFGYSHGALYAVDFAHRIAKLPKPVEIQYLGLADPVLGAGYLGDLVFGIIHLVRGDDLTFATLPSNIGSKLLVLGTKKGLGDTVLDNTIFTSKHIKGFSASEVFLGAGMPHRNIHMNPKVYDWIWGMYKARTKKARQAVFKSYLKSTLDWFMKHKTQKQEVEFLKLMLSSYIGKSAQSIGTHLKLTAAMRELGLSK
jgi:hypothetical protein